MADEKIKYYHPQLQHNTETDEWSASETIRVKGKTPGEVVDKLMRVKQSVERAMEILERTTAVLPE